ncbi:hypothetical protein ACP4OV_001740 [Aristida adscensionis]
MYNTRSDQSTTTDRGIETPACGREGSRATVESATATSRTYGGMSSGYYSEAEDSAAYFAAFRKLTMAEKSAQRARIKAIACFTIDNRTERSRLLQEDPSRAYRPEELPPASWSPEWKAALAQILDAHPVPEAMRQPEIESYYMRICLPREPEAPSPPSSPSSSRYP